MKAFDEDGMPIDIDMLMGITVNCFMCSSMLKEKGGLLLSPPEEEFSDNVDKVDKFHLCKKCFNVLLDFSMGKIKQIEVPTKLDLIIYSIMQGKFLEARKQINELKEKLISGEKIGI